MIKEVYQILDKKLDFNHMLNNISDRLNDFILINDSLFEKLKNNHNIYSLKSLYTNNKIKRISTNNKVLNSLNFEDYNTSYFLNFDLSQKALSLIKRIENRDFYKFVGDIILRKDTDVEKVSISNIVSCCENSSSSKINLKEEDLVLKILVFSYGNNSKDPVLDTYFYQNKTSKQYYNEESSIVHINKDEYLMEAPLKFKETVVRLYVKSCNKLNLAINALIKFNNVYLGGDKYHDYCKSNSAKKSNQDYSNFLNENDDVNYLNQDFSDNMYNSNISFNNISYNNKQFIKSYNNNNNSNYYEFKKTKDYDSNYIKFINKVIDDKCESNLYTNLNKNNSSIDLNLKDDNN